MSEIINITDDQRRSLEHDSTEVTKAELQSLINAKGEQWKSTDAGKAIIALLEKKDAATTAATTATEKSLAEEKAKREKAEQELADLKKGNSKGGVSGSWGENMKDRATNYLQKPFATENTGAFDQAEYVYGVLLRHGVMPDKHIGFFNASPDDPLWKQGLMKGLDYAFNKMPIVKHLDFPADIGRATYTYPTQLRNYFADKIGTMKKDEFDAMLMALSRENDYHQKLIGAISEIQKGIQGSAAKKDTVDWLKSVTAQKESLEAMMALIKTENPDLQGLANHLTSYAEARKAYDMTEFGKIMAIHNEIDPARKTQMITDLKTEIKGRETSSRREHAIEIRVERASKQEIDQANKDFDVSKKALDADLANLEKEKRKFESEKIDIERQVARNENSKNAILGGKNSDATAIANYDVIISGLENNRNTKQGEIDAKTTAIDAKRLEITTLQEQHMRKVQKLQTELEKTVVKRTEGKTKLDASAGKTREQYAVVDNILTNHYTTSSHQEGGAARYARAIGGKDPHIASIESTLLTKNTPANITAKKSAIQVELQNPDIIRLTDLERRGLLTEFQSAAMAVESLSNGAEEALKKLRSGSGPEQIRAGEEYLKGFGEAVHNSNTQIGAINDKMLSTWTKLSKLDQDAILHAASGSSSYKYVASLASHDTIMKSKAEWMTKNVSQAKPMRFMYGLIGIVAAGSLTTEFAFGNAEVAKNDLKDMAYGFVPGYDLYRAWDGTDLNGRPIRGLDRFERAAWGTLTLAGAVATLGASSLVIGGLRTGVKGVKAANTLGNVVKVGSSGMAVASVSHFGYNLVGMNWKQVGPNGEKIVKIQ